MLALKSDQHSTSFVSTQTGQQVTLLKCTAYKAHGNFACLLIYYTQASFGLFIKFEGMFVYAVIDTFICF